jgi:hypothetical protein
MYRIPIGVTIDYVKSSSGEFDLIEHLFYYQLNFTNKHAIAKFAQLLLLYHLVN